MSKENILRITLFVSVLALNPAVAERLKLTTNIQTQQETRVTTSIAKILHKRGLDEDAAKALSQNLVSEDEELFARMLENLLNGCKNISKDEVLAYLSNEALFRKNVDLKNYDHLVALASSVKQIALDETILQQLQQVVKQNRELKA